MTKAELIAEIAQHLGMDKEDVTGVLEAFFKTVKTKMTEGENIYVRGFGSFLIKKRAEKKGRIIKRNEEIIIAEHYIPAFKPSKYFMDKVKNSKIIKERAAYVLQQKPPADIDAEE